MTPEYLDSIVCLADDYIRSHSPREELPEALYQFLTAQAEMAFNTGRGHLLDYRRALWQLQHVPAPMLTSTALAAVLRDLAAHLLECAEASERMRGAA